MKQQTAAQIAAATAKRMASIAARQANGGMTVRQQRAAAKAAKAGQPYTPPAPQAPRAPRAPRAARPFGGRRRRNRGFTPPSSTSIPPQGAPIFSTPPPAVRPMRLAALVAIEQAFKAACDANPAMKTQELRDAFAKYQKVKTLALGQVNNSATQNEADAALRMAVVHLVKLAF